jgi:hypothetical protein
LKPLLFAFAADAFADTVVFDTGFALVLDIDFEVMDAVLLLLSTRVGALKGRLRFLAPSEDMRPDATDCERSGKSRSVYFIASFFDIECRVLGC